MPITQANSSKIPFTLEEYERLKAELARLTKEQAELLVRLQTAREMGDLSENGAYKYAKIELGNTRREIRRLQHLVANGYVAAKNTNGQVGFGSVITVQDGSSTKTFTLVSKHESDPMKGKISFESPLGQQLVGKREGDHVTVQTPKGERKYLIVKIT